MEINLKLNHENLKKRYTIDGVNLFELNGRET